MLNFYNGVHLFINAIDYNISGCQFITVDSLNNPRTNKFYLKYGFINQTNTDINKTTRRMYFPLKIYD